MIQENAMIRKNGVDKMSSDKMGSRRSQRWCAYIFCTTRVSVFGNFLHWVEVQIHAKELG
jgi:hypothetical protein